MDIYTLHSKLIKNIAIYKDDRSDIETLHAIRVNARKILSFSDENYDIKDTKIKNIIKKSNSLRDLDVFIYELIPSFDIDLEILKEKIIIAKAKKEANFLGYLNSEDFDTLDICIKSVDDKKKTKELKQRLKQIDLDMLSFCDLHSLRKDIKVLRYNSTDKSVAKNLAKIQDNLGSVQNYYQLYIYATNFYLGDEKLDIIKQKLLMQKQSAISDTKKVLNKIL